MNTADTKEGQMFLLDAGSKYNRYASDITSTFPVSGKFTEKQAAIYNIVLKANREVVKAIQVGINWQELHILSEKIIIEGLVNLGILKGTVEDLWEKRVSYTFYPHGLGHYIGTYTHDPPGDPKFENERKQIKDQTIRFARKLQDRMCVTVEPGLYFIDGLLEKAKNDEATKDCYDFDLIAEYDKEINAVRVEDVVLVTPKGGESLSHVPRTVEEIEACMAGKEWNIKA